MTTVTVNVSFPKPLIKTMDAVAKQEARTRSELLREAVRLYVERKRRWDNLFAFGRQHAKQLGLKPQNVEPMIAESRREQTHQR
ncbi:MAG: ribbon-helix-helix domain-containing protein [Candidatus Omnitrophota bacterium]|nr:ribbon-helix-helix domain-containing protein [Candidatus Omnitrophota bacterium]